MGCTGVSSSPFPALFGTSGFPWQSLHSHFQSHPTEASNTARLPLMGCYLCPCSTVACFQEPFLQRSLHFGFASVSVALAASPVNLAQPGIFGAHQLGQSAPFPTSSMPACLSFPDMIKITGALKD